jgi:YVTN family beta-propeller protein
VSRAATDPRIGTELGGYLIESLVGRGGMGVVYLAQDLRLERKVALKLLPPELSADESFRDRFLRESRIAASLDHRSIVPIYDAGEIEGVLFIAMRYVEGTDLRTLLRRHGRLEPPRALAIAAQVASALDAAHARGLVHRDVKPANILVAEEAGSEEGDHVYLSDFGLTKATGSGTRLTTTGQLVGTIDYVPPEQITGGEVDGRGDQYALTCVLYECLTGEPPYPRDSEVAVLWAHVQDEPPRATDRDDGLPEGLDAVLARGIAKTPADRYSTCRELVASARRELGVSTTGAPLPVGAVAAPPSPRRHRRLAVLAALAAIVLVAVAAVVVAVLVAGGDGQAGEEPNAPTTIPIDSLSSLEPSTGAFRTTVPVGARPESLAIAADGIWVANFDDRTVSRVDPAQNAVVKVIGAGGTPTGIAVGEGAVWVTNSFEGKLTRIDPARGAIDDSIPLGSGAKAIAVGEGAVWVANGFGGTLLRIDPATGDVAATIDVGESPTGVAVSVGAVWVANSGDSTLARIDPATNEVVEKIGLRFAPQGVAVGPSGVWVTNPGDDSVSRIDPETNRVAATVESVGDGPSGIAVTEDAVWVTNSIGGTIARVDPATGDVVATIDVGASPDGIAVAGDGAVWFTTHAL